VNDHRGRPRVVITGAGVKVPGSNDVDSFWARLRSGRSAAAPIARFDASALPVRFACEVHDFDPEAYLGKKEPRRLDRVTHLGFAAAIDALDDAGDLGADPSRCAVLVGTGVGGLDTLEANLKTYFTRAPMRVSPFFVPMMMPNATAGVIGMHIGWTGPNLCITTACAAGSHAIGEGVRLIRDGTSDVVLAGGTEAPVDGPTVAAFARMGALSRRNDEPERASRPFDADRDGFVIGEGAAFIVLESLDRARSRDAKVLGEVLGYGRNADAYHITAPAPGGSGAAACMQLALDDAGLPTDAIGHVNAHGTATELNDLAEAEAVRKVWGDDAPPVTSTKGVTGHLIGAAGAAEAIAATLAARTGIIPPTANFERLGENITLDVVAAERPVEPAPALSNSFGFGGHNASLIVAPPPG